MRPRQKWGTRFAVAMEVGVDFLGDLSTRFASVEMTVAVEMVSVVVVQERWRGD